MVQDMLVVDPSRIRDLSPEALDADGRLKVLPAEYWASTSPEERALFGTRSGLYSFPTTELVEYLGNVIDGRTAIEIGAGHGVLADALGIVGTDSYQQQQPDVRAAYEAQGWAIAPYGPNVEQLDAHAAAAKYEPQVIIGCWVTHKYDPARHYAGGNEAGPDEYQLLLAGSVELYVSVGNEKVHQHKPIWNVPHEITYSQWLVSRAWNGSRDFVASWHR